jgi:peptidoglycan/LPS O-acetylase OafA/YrhL
MESLAHHANSRRHDLDWLRVFAFGLLILYHIGMLYVHRWGYHFKSQYTSAGLENVMLLVNPWRMPLLWMVSGIASCYMLEKMSWARFSVLRTYRLLLPLAFGLWVIVPPQLFVEMTGKGDFSGSYLEFYRKFLQPDALEFANYSSGIWPHVDVNHLWYLRELWQFTLLLLLLLPLLNWLGRGSIISRAIVPGGPFTVLLAFPVFMVLVDLAGLPDIGTEDRRIALGLIFFICGFMFTHRSRIWTSLERSRHLALGLALTTYILFLLAYHLIWIDRANGITDPMGLALVFLDHFNRWFWLCAVFGYAHLHLNRPHPWLDYLSPGVYTFYLVHQTIILLLAWWLSPLALGPVAEPLLVILSTFFACIAIYELARRVRLLRPLFGLKWIPTESTTSDSRWSLATRTVLAGVIIVPLGLEILW